MSKIVVLSAVLISPAQLAVSTEPQVTGSTHVVFMEPVDANANSPHPTYQQVTDADRISMYTKWLENDSARTAIELYDLAWSVMRQRGKAESLPPPYHVALVPGGNHADCGFRLREADGTKDLPTTPYIKLAPQPYRFGNTFLHETGHVVLSALNDGEGVPARSIASIPHTTAALTDRGTAFNEGFAIHLETLDAHLNQSPEIRNRYHHESFVFGSNSIRESEYFRHAADLMTYSQTIARYFEVRENNFAFASAHKGPNYLRVQLEKARDFAALRDANQLLQSEGAYASFFFAYTFRGESMPTESVIRQRQEKMLATLAEMFATYPPQQDAPYMLQFVETFMRLYPEEGPQIIDVLLDLSHGVFVDPDALALWREFYDAALMLDMRGMPKRKIKSKRAEWRKAVKEDPKVLYSRLGPQLPCKVESITVRLVALGRDSPLRFDVNTVQEGVIRLIPGVTDDEVSQWLKQRGQKPFVDIDDFKSRVPLNDDALGAMNFSPPTGFH